MKAWIIVFSALIAVCAGQSCSVAAHCEYSDGSKNYEFRRLPSKAEVNAMNKVTNAPPPTSPPRKTNNKRYAACGKINDDDAGWVNGANGYQYKLRNENVQYETAITLCEKDGGTLLGPTLRDPAALAYFRDNVQTMFNVNGYWVGATDSKVEDTWVWEGAGTLSKNSDLWSQNQPDNWNDQDCAWLPGYHGAQLKLDDGDCAGNFRIMCERKRS